MHHRPAGPPLSVRLSAAVRRTWLVLRLGLRRSRRRVALGLAATVAVTAALLAVPVTVTVSVPEVLSLDPSAGSSSSASSVSSPPAGRSSGESSTSVFPEQPLPSTTAPGTRPAASAAPPAPGPAPLPAPAPAPAGEPAPAPQGAAPGTPADAPTASAPPSAAATTPSGTSAAGPAPTAAAAVTPAVLGVEAEVLALVNRARADAGCGALVPDPGLAALARAHSADMRDRDFFAHVNLAGQDPFQRAAAAGVTARAENIARGQQDAAGVMASWMDSAGHRANILDCDLRSLGVGVATGAGGPWWTQVFG